MKKINKFLKSNIKVLIAFILGAVIFGTTVYATTVLSSGDVSYNNTSSGLTATTVQGAIDEVYKKADIRKQGNFISAYSYNSSTCVTGEEDTCVKTDCYKNKTAGSCKAGDIIKYKVNDTDIVTFHVMFDNGNTLTMQSQKNTINNTMWIDQADYTVENTDSTSCIYPSCNDEGPMTVLVALERATKSWTNVNNQTYTMGTTSLSNKGEFTVCSAYNLCNTNTHTLDERTAKTRMITVQEAAALGCTKSERSCQSWLNNYLYDSTNYGGTVNDSTIDPSADIKNYGYWTMNTSTSYTNFSWNISYKGNLGGETLYYTGLGARAVVEVSK